MSEPGVANASGHYLQAGLATGTAEKLGTVWHQRCCRRDLVEGSHPCGPEASACDTAKTGRPANVPEGKPFEELNHQLVFRSLVAEHTGLPTGTRHQTVRNASLLHRPTPGAVLLDEPWLKRTRRIRFEAAQHFMQLARVECARELQLRKRTSSLPLPFLVCAGRFGRPAWSANRSSCSAHHASQEAAQRPMRQSWRDTQ